MGKWGKKSKQAVVKEGSLDANPTSSGLEGDFGGTGFSGSGLSTCGSGEKGLTLNGVDGRERDKKRLNKPQSRRVRTDVPPEHNRSTLVQPTRFAGTG